MASPTPAAPYGALVTGIIFTVAGSCAMASGNVCMKIGIRKETEKLAIEDTTLSAWALAQPAWWSGICQYVAGAVLHIAALAFAPASILAPMNALGLIANAIVASTVLKESFGWAEVVGTTGTFVGVTLCAASSFLSNDVSQTVSGIDSWRDPWFLTYAGFATTVALVCLIVVHAEETRINEEAWTRSFRRHVEAGHIEMGERLPTPTDQYRTVAADDVEAAVPSHTLDSSSVEDRPPHPPHLGLIYGLLAGVVGAQCVLEIKEFVACIQAGMSDPRVWWSPQPYAALGVTIAAALLQVHFLNFGLGRGEATHVVPTYYVFWTAFGALGGFAKFHEFTGFSTMQMILFFTGLSLTLVFVGVLAIKEVANVKSELDRTMTMTLPYGELQKMEAERSIRRKVPLAFGYSLIPLGTLGGRVPKSERSLGFRRQSFAIRRTKSLTELTVPTLAATATAGPAAGEAGADDPAYNWTIGGGKLESLVMPPGESICGPPHRQRPERSHWLDPDSKKNTAFAPLRSPLPKPRDKPRPLDESRLPGPASHPRPGRAEGSDCRPPHDGPPVAATRRRHMDELVFDAELADSLLGS